MNNDTLKTFVSTYSEADSTPGEKEFALFIEHFLSALEAGEIRSAQKDNHGKWSANTWVKQGILLGFKYGKNQKQADSNLIFFDKHTFPILRPQGEERNIRIVPGGSSVRRGSYIGKNVTMMPPMYVNVGAFVDDGTMVDSHALVGSCAQIGKNVHLSAAAQIGGVLEPIGASPVIVEDHALIGGNVGIYEGTQIGARAVIAAGVVLTRSVPVYDLVNEKVIRAEKDAPLKIPDNAVVVQGSRPINSNNWAKDLGLHLSTPVIVKYRDEKTDSATSLESLLR